MADNISVTQLLHADPGGRYLARCTIWIIHPQKPKAFIFIYFNKLNIFTRNQQKIQGVNNSDDKPLFQLLVLLTGMILNEKVVSSRSKLLKP